MDIPWLSVAGGRRAAAVRSGGGWCTGAGGAEEGSGPWGGHRLPRAWWPWPHQGGCEGWLPICGGRRGYGPPRPLPPQQGGGVEVGDTAPPGLHTQPSHPGARPCRSAPWATFLLTARSLCGRTAWRPDAVGLVFRDRLSSSPPLVQSARHRRPLGSSFHPSPHLHTHAGPPLLSSSLTPEKGEPRSDQTKPLSC